MKEGKEGKKRRRKEMKEGREETDRKTVVNFAREDDVLG
jgi:hypothetical protein